MSLFQEVFSYFLELLIDVIVIQVGSLFRANFIWVSILLNLTTFSKLTDHELFAFLWGRILDNLYEDIDSVSDFILVFFIDVCLYLFTDPRF